LNGFERLWTRWKSLPVAAALAASFVLAYLPAVARATPVYETLGAINSTTPYSARIIPVGPVSAFFNPSLLVYQDKGAYVGFYYLHQELDVDYMARPAGADISAAAYDSRPADPSSVPADRLRPVPTGSLANQRGSSSSVSDGGYVGFGTTVHTYKKYLSIGFFMQMAISSFQAQRPYFADEREQYFSNSLHFELLDDRLANASLVFALASQPVKWMSLGIGLTMATTASTTSRIFVSDFSRGSSPLVSPEVSIGTTFVPHAAITFEPIQNLLLSLIFHWKYGSPMTTATEQQMWNYTYPDGETVNVAEYKFGYGYLPIRLGLGVSWTGDAGSRLKYTVAATATWNKWSDYTDRHTDSPVLGWHDTFPVTLAGKFFVDGAHEVALDMTFVQSPVPDQDGRTNYVDNSRLGIATGYTFHLPIKKFKLTIGAQFQCQYLFPRSVVKSPDSADPVIDEFPDSIYYVTDEFVAESAGLQTNNPGFPGFGSSGWMMGAGVRFSFHY